MILHQDSLSILKASIDKKFKWTIKPRYCQAWCITKDFINLLESNMASWKPDLSLTILVRGVTTVEQFLQKLL